MYHGSYVLEALNILVTTDGTKYDVYGVMGFVSYGCVYLIIVGSTFSTQKEEEGVTTWINESYACMQQFHLARRKYFYIIIARLGKII